MDDNSESLLKLKITKAVNNNVKCKSRVCLWQDSIGHFPLTEMWNVCQLMDSEEQKMS